MKANEGRAAPGSGLRSGREAGEGGMGHGRRGLGLGDDVIRARGMEGWPQSRRDRQREAASGTPGPQPDALPIKADAYGMTWGGRGGGCYPRPPWHASAVSSSVSKHQSTINTQSPIKSPKPCLFKSARTGFYKATHQNDEKDPGKRRLKTTPR